MAPGARESSITLRDLDQRLADHAEKDDMRHEEFVKFMAVSGEFIRQTNNSITSITGSIVALTTAVSEARTADAVKDATAKATESEREKHARNARRWLALVITVSIGIIGPLVTVIAEHLLK